MEVIQKQNTHSQKYLEETFEKVFHKLVEKLKRLGAKVPNISLNLYPKLKYSNKSYYDPEKNEIGININSDNIEVDLAEEIMHWIRACCKGIVGKRDLDERHVEEFIGALGRALLGYKAQILKKKAVYDYVMEYEKIIRKYNNKSIEELRKFIEEYEKYCNVLFEILSLLDKLLMGKSTDKNKLIENLYRASEIIEENIEEIIEIIKKEKYDEEDLYILNGLRHFVTQKWAELTMRISSTWMFLLFCDITAFKARVEKYRVSSHFIGYELAERILKKGIDKLFKQSPDLLYLSTKDIERILKNFI